LYKVAIDKYHKKAPNPQIPPPMSTKKETASKNSLSSLSFSSKNYFLARFFLNREMKFKAQVQINTGAYFSYVRI